MVLQVEIDHANEKKRSVQELPKKQIPEFTRHKPDLGYIKQLADQHEFENLIVIGNGGSITSFRAYLYAFLPETDIIVHPVTSMDPDYLNRLSKATSPDDTLVMPISKSGETVGVIESLMYFVKRGYGVFAVTSDNDGALKNIVERRDYGWIEHPDIGGRFTGATETALVPAAFAGIEVSEIRRGAEEMYEKLSPKKQYNPALNVASALYDLEQEGYTDVFAPFYSTRMFGYYPLLVQLMHETVCKDGEGQTFSGDLGPEYQHHTNQRIFGGRKDIVPMFFRTDTHEREDIEIPEELEDIEIRGRRLGELNGKTLQNSLKAEYQGVKQALDEEGRPSITVNLVDLSHESAGKLVAFLQYLAVYTAWLHEVDPFTQPDVETSKKLGFENRF